MGCHFDACAVRNFMGVCVRDKGRNVIDLFIFSVHYASETPAVINYLSTVNTHSGMA